MKTKQLHIIVITTLLLIGAAYYLSPKQNNAPAFIPDLALAAKFDYLSKNGNSACSANFQQSIKTMSDGTRIQGSCCSPMSSHRYQEQIEELKKYKDIPEIPPDPYDVDAKLAKEYLAYYDFQLNTQEQAAYDYAMMHSNEKGPCCCQCWHWYVYGGLAKKLIHERAFTGPQITEIWNLSDGCGGADEHL